MIQYLDHTTYTSCLHEVFRADTPDSFIALELDEVEVHATGPEDESSRRAFTLIFLGPKNAPLPEGMVSLAHTDLGKVELYLIPILSQGERQAYQAVFN